MNLGWTLRIANGFGLPDPDPFPVDPTRSHVSGTLENWAYDGKKNNIAGFEYQASQAGDAKPT